MSGSRPRVSQGGETNGGVERGRWVTPFPMKTIPTATATVVLTEVAVATAAVEVTGAAEASQEPRTHRLNRLCFGAPRRRVQTNETCPLADADGAAVYRPAVPRQV